MTVRKRKEVLAMGRMDGSFQMAVNMAGRITKLLLEMGRSGKDLLVDTHHDNRVLDPSPRNMARSSNPDLLTLLPLPARERGELTIITMSSSCYSQSTVVGEEMLLHVKHPFC